MKVGSWMDAIDATTTETVAKTTKAAAPGTVETTTTVAHRPGWKTSEFWITIAVVLVNHLLRAVERTPGAAGLIASALIDAVAASGYTVSRAIVKTRQAGAALVLAVVLVAGGCAHVGPVVRACAEQLTPDLTQTAVLALAGQDYESAIANRLAGVAACLVVAAVEAAVDQAKHYKLRGDVDQAAVARHGDAWMAAHRRTG
jgi:hypothetical protein